MAGLLAHKGLRPGCTTLERFVARLRARVEDRLWKRLGRGITDAQRTRLEDLLTVPPPGRSSWLDQLRSGPVRVSGRALVQAIQRLQAVRDLGIRLPPAGVPPSRLAALARFAGTAKVTAISRLPPVRRLATLVAFVHCLEATAQDDAVEVLDVLLHEFFSAAAKADQKARLRGIKDLDQAATVLATACRTVLDPTLADGDLRNTVFARIPREALAQALADVEALVRPPDDVYYRELDARYRVVRIFLPTLLRHIRFGASPAGAPVVAGLDWLRTHEVQVKPAPPAPREVITKPWQRHVLREDGSVDPRAYTFCVLDGRRKALRRREVFVSPSWRYADPRAGLLAGAEWETTRPIICRSRRMGRRRVAYVHSLPGCSSNPKPLPSRPPEWLVALPKRIAAAEAKVFEHRVVEAQQGAALAIDGIPVAQPGQPGGEARANAGQGVGR